MAAGKGYLAGGGEPPETQKKRRDGWGSKAPDGGGDNINRERREGARRRETKGRRGDGENGYIVSSGRQSGALRRGAGNQTQRGDWVPGTPRGTYKKGNGGWGTIPPSHGKASGGERG